MAGADALPFQEGFRFIRNASRLTGTRGTSTEIDDFKLLSITGASSAMLGFSKSARKGNSTPNSLRIREIT
jgi:hypothetical protein